MAKLLLNGPNRNLLRTAGIPFIMIHLAAFTHASMALRVADRCFTAPRW